MSRHEVESWGTTQLYRLRDFFSTAQAGDTVVFDQRLVEDNGGENWMYRVASIAATQSGMSAKVQETIKFELAQLQPFYPERKP